MKPARFTMGTTAALLAIACGWMVGCERVPPPSPTEPAQSEAPPPLNPWEEARRRGVEFRAIGQEPGWVIELDEGQALRFAGDYGETTVQALAAAPVREEASGTVTYTAKAEGGDLVLIVRETACEDSMSGESFPYAATVRWSGKELHGCGRTLTNNEVLRTYWKLVELGGVPAVASSGPREPHLRLNPDESRATGSTGCNMFSGPFTLDGEQVRWGPFISTRMACIEPAMNRQEQDFLRALETTNRLAVADDGRLVLYAGESPLARFEPVHLR